MNQSNVRDKGTQNPKEPLIVKAGAEAVNDALVTAESKEQAAVALASTRSQALGKDVEAKQQWGTIALAGLIAVGLVCFLTGFFSTNSSTAQERKPQLSSAGNSSAQPNTPGDSVGAAKSSVPILSAGQSGSPLPGNQSITPNLLGSAANHLSGVERITTAAGSLGNIQPFDNNGTWQPPAYQGGSDSNALTASDDQGDKRDKELDKPSIVFVHNEPHVASNATELPGLTPGIRLRAHLESMATTAVSTPVIAIVDYSYMHDGEILVPAGAKAIGRLEQADRSGYISIRFESLLMPDGASIAISATATDLALRPLKGRVQGSHSGKNIVVRSLTGIGTIGSMLIGQSGLNQPVSQTDLLRQQEANNLGQTADNEVSKLSVTEHIVVSVPANTGIYVVLQTKTVQTNGAGTNPHAPANMADTKQVQQWQKELNQNQPQ